MPFSNFFKNNYFRYPSIRAAAGLSTKGFDNVGSHKEEYLFDCKNKRTSLLSSYDYNTGGSTISARSISKTEWVDIAPESVMEGAADIICK